MAVETRVYQITREQSVLDDDGFDRGNARNTVAATGHKPGGVYLTIRDLWYVPFEEALGDVIQIIAARAWFEVLPSTDLVGTTIETLAAGSSPQIRFRPLASAGGGAIFGNSSGNANPNNWTGDAFAKWDTQPALIPGPPTGDAPTVVGSMAPGTGLRSVNIAPLIEYHAPARVLDRSGNPCKGATNYGWRLYATDESAATNNVIFASIRDSSTSSRPYIEIDVEVNSPPFAPEVTSPAPTSGRTSDPTIVATLGGREVKVLFNFSDLEDALAGAAQLQILANGATDTAPGTSIADTGWLLPGAGLVKEPGSGKYSIKVTGLPRPHQDATHGDWRLRVRARDPKGKVGPWTSVDAGGIRTAYIVGAPTQQSMQTTPNAPRIFGTLNSPGPAGTDWITAWEGEFYRDTSQGAENLWPTAGIIAIGGTSTTRSNIPYAGTSLNDGDDVRRRQRHYNRDEVAGTWGAFQHTIINLPGGPTFIPPDTGTKLTSRTAAVTIVFDEESEAYHWWLYRGGVQIHDSGETVIVPADSVDVTLPVGRVGWGDGGPGNALEIEAQARPTDLDDFGPLSGRSGLYVNQLPSTTTTAGDGEVSGVPVVGTTDVVWTSPVIDPDDTIATMVASELEVRTAAVPAGSGALLFRRVLTTGITEVENTLPDIIPAESSVDGRKRYYDGADPLAVFTLAADTAAGAAIIKYNAPTFGAIAVGDEITLTGASTGTRTVTAVGTTGAGGTGLEVSESFGVARTSGTSGYIWPWGPWSNWATVKASADPVVAAVSPADGALIEHPRPDLVHSYESIKAQAYRTVLFYERDPEQGDSLVWEKNILGTELTDTVPTLLLGSGKVYAWQKVVYDTDGLSTTTELRTFATAFNVPDPVGGITATADATSSGITLSWAITDALVYTLDPPEVVTAAVGGADVIAGVSLLLATITPGAPTSEEDVTVDASLAIIDHFRVYWIDQAGNAIRIDGGPVFLGDGLTPLEAMTFTYYGARLGSNTFRVTVHNGALESDPVAVTVDLSPSRAGASQLVTDGLARYTFPFDLDSAPRQHNPQISQMDVPGGRTVYQIWGVSARTVSVRFTYLPRMDGDLLTPLREMLKAGSATWVKLPAGYQWDVMRVLLRNLRDEVQTNGFVTVQAELGETSWRQT